VNCGDAASTRAKFGLPTGQPGGIGRRAASGRSNLAPSIALLRGPTDGPGGGAARGTTDSVRGVARSLDRYERRELNQTDAAEMSRDSERNSVAAAKKLRRFKASHPTR
jgi:hypothetical protein